MGSSPSCRDISAADLRQAADPTGGTVVPETPSALGTPHAAAQHIGQAPTQPSSSASPRLDPGAALWATV
jgi:hypothetical protein